MVLLEQQLTMIYVYVVICISIQANMIYPVSSNDFTCGSFSINVTKRQTGELDITEATLNMTHKVIYPTVVWFWVLIKWAKYTSVLF